MNKLFKLILICILLCITYINVFILSSAVIVNHGINAQTFELSKLLLSSLITRIDFYLSTHYYCPWLMVFPRADLGNVAYYHVVYNSLPFFYCDNALQTSEWLLACVNILIDNLTAPMLAFVFLILSTYLSLKAFVHVTIALFNLILKIGNFIFKSLNLLISSVSTN